MVNFSTFYHAERHRNYLGFTVHFQDIFRTPYIFAVSTQARALLLAAGSEAEASGWLYAFNPLLASNKYFEVNFNPSHQEEVEE